MNDLWRILVAVFGSLAAFFTAGKHCDLFVLSQLGLHSIDD